MKYIMMKDKKDSRLNLKKVINYHAYERGTSEYFIKLYTNHIEPVYFEYENKKERDSILNQLDILVNLENIYDILFEKLLK